MIFVASLSLPESVLRNHFRCLRWRRIKTSGAGWANSMVIAASLRGSWTVWCLQGHQMLAAGIIQTLAFRWSRTAQSTSSTWSWISLTTALMPSTGVPRYIVILDYLHLLAKDFPECFLFFFVCCKSLFPCSSFDLLQWQLTKSIRTWLTCVTTTKPSSLATLTRFGSLWKWSSARNRIVRFRVSRCGTWTALRRDWFARQLLRCVTTWSLALEIWNSIY